MADRRTRAPLPGVTITWAPNPLLSVVTLDEMARIVLWHRLKIETLVDEHIGRTYFELDPEMQKHRERSGKPPRTPEETIAVAMRELKFEYACGDEEWHGKTIDQRTDEYTERLVQDLAGPHDGDCTCVPCSCLKCRAESILEIDTIPGLGKHEASKIGGYFKAGLSPAEVVQRLADYEPVYKDNPNWKREDWEQHVPRWREEGKRAHAWLVAYLAEHFPGAAS